MSLNTQLCFRSPLHIFMLGPLPALHKFLKWCMRAQNMIPPIKLKESQCSYSKTEAKGSLHQKSHLGCPWGRSAPGHQHKEVVGSSGFVAEIFYRKFIFQSTIAAQKQDIHAHFS